MKDRKKLDRLLAALETYVVSLIREAVSPNAAPGEQVRWQATADAREKLLDAIERMDP